MYTRMQPGSIRRHIRLLRANPWNFRKDPYCGLPQPRRRRAACTIPDRRPSHVPPFPRIRPAGIALLCPLPAAADMELNNMFAERKFVPASAAIAKDGRIEVWSDAVPEPVAVRYAWADNPVCNMYSAAGLPLTPFRTDDFPGITVGKQ